MKKILIILITLFIVSVSVFTWLKLKKDKPNSELTHIENIENLEESRDIPELSIYNLPSNWYDQNNKPVLLKDYQGRINIVTLIFTRCEYACPRLVADIKSIESQLTSEELKKVNFLLISIDPENDTPEVLLKYASDKDLDLNHWTLLNGDADDVLELAMTLGVKYKKVSPIDFSHSNIISVFSKNGVLKYQQEGFGNDNTKVVQEINKLF